MSLDRDKLRVPLNGYVMQLRRSELESVASGLGEFDVSEEGNLIRLAEALRQMPANERAPLWELAIRRFGRRKPLEQAAGEIGMDAIRARQLLRGFTQALGKAPLPDNPATL